MASEAPAPILPDISPSLPARVHLGLLRAEPVAVAASSPALEDEIERARAELASRLAGLPPASIPGLEPARRLYRAFGIDPTRTRPSSEALLRRVLQGKPLPRILNAVDLCTLCSLRFLLPIGLYDAERIRGRVVLRTGGPGEAYPGVRKEVVRLEGRPVLADQEGPFGNPTADSMRTAVRTETRSLWMVVFAPADIPDPELQGHLAWGRAKMEEHLAPADGPVLTASALHRGG